MSTQKVENSSRHMLKDQSALTMINICKDENVFFAYFESLFHSILSSHLSIMPNNRSLY